MIEFRLSWKLVKKEEHFVFDHVAERKRIIMNQIQSGSV